uniref:Uncharacterized protein n=1 Tax=Octopus bimaculoides TaxID=37653 RepID=A0A0L8I9H7_OCTBM
MRWNCKGGGNIVFAFSSVSRNTLTMETSARFGNLTGFTKFLSPVRVFPFYGSKVLHIGGKIVLI